MKKPYPLSLLALLLLSLHQPACAEEIDTSQLERDLQHLEWVRFRAVIESIPKLKADVDAYGAFGWQYVQANYANYPWKKKIDKLNDEQKQQLAQLIAKNKRSP